MRVDAVRTLSLAAVFVAGCSGEVQPISPVDAGTTPNPPPGEDPCALSVPAPAPRGSWAALPISGAKINAILPLADGTLVVATGATRPLGSPGVNRPGLYRSSDQGQTFTRVAEQPGAELTSLVEGPAGEVWAAYSAIATGGTAGILHSPDGGRTFTPSAPGLPSWARPRALAFAPGATPRLFLLAEGSEVDPGAAVSSLFRKEGAGDWVLLAAEGINPDPGGALTAIAAAPDGQTLYAADGARFWVSTDDGDHFSDVDLSEVFAPTGFGRITGIFPDPRGAGRLFLASPDVGLLERPDGTAPFRRRSGLPSAPVRSVAFDAEAMWIATEGQGLYRLDDVGFTQIGACLEQEIVTTVAAQAGRRWVGTAGSGVLRFGGERFVPSTGFGELEGRVVVRPGPSGPVAWLLSPAGVFRWRGDRSAWDRVRLGATHLDVADVVQLEGGALLYATDEDLYEGGERALGVLRVEQGAPTAASGLSGRHFRRLLAQSGGPSYVLQVRSPAERPEGGDFGLYRSEDAGRSFSRTTYGTTDNYPSYPYAFDVSPAAISAAGTLLVGSLASDAPLSRALLRSDDQGATFTAVWSDAALTSPFAEVNGVYADPAGRVAITGRDQGPFLLLSDDDGRTFTSSVTTFPAGVLSILDAELLSGGAAALAGGAAGVLVAEDGLDYSVLGPELMATAHQVAVLPGTPRVVFVSTKERGVLWRTW